MPVDERNARSHQQALADLLVVAGKVTSREWDRVFRTVPRHVFVPRFYRPGDDGLDFVVVKEGDPGWLDGVYRDEPLVTQVDTGQPDGGDRGVVKGDATSSSSAPGLMAAMLEALNVADVHRVLEVGTGTGYNAALLCERLGDERVVSVDLDPELTGSTRERLAAAGYHPTISIGDGVAGYAPGAPYDRVIVTCGFPRVPRPLIEQTTDGGILVVPLFRDHLNAGVIARLEVTDGVARGRILGQYGGFMPNRALPRRDTLALYERYADQDQAGAGHTRHSPFPDDPSYCGEPWLVLASLTLPDGGAISSIDEDGTVHHWLVGDDGSWGSLTPSAGTVTQGGPRRLWDEVESARDNWLALGEPDRERFGLTVEADGRHVLWLDDPAGHTWDVPP